MGGRESGWYIAGAQTNMSGIKVNIGHGQLGEEGAVDRSSEMRNKEFLNTDWQIGSLPGLQANCDFMKVVSKG